MLNPALIMSEKIKDLSFEEAVKQLEEIVNALESGAKPLEESIADYTRGNELKNAAAKKLADAKAKIEKIVSENAGDVKTEDFS